MKPRPCTGLLLIPSGSVEGEPPGSHAIDTLTGKIMWQASALPGIDLLFSFPDAGLAVLRSPDDGGRLIAIDLLTGERVWEIANWARMAWTDAPYLRVVVESTPSDARRPHGRDGPRGRCDVAQDNEIIRLTTGMPIINVKKGFWGAPISVSPSGQYIAYAGGDSMQVLAGDSGDILHDIQYPKGGEGMKTLRYMSWPTDDFVMAVFPDKKGNPRKMTGFSCSKGSMAWTTVLPDVADYQLTSEQRAQLIGRIMTSLIMTAVSAANPVSAGGTSYYAVFVPDLNVSESFAPGVAPSRGGETGGEAPFAAALARYSECEQRIDATSETVRYFVVGPKRLYDILRIDLVGGDVEPVRRYAADKVHAISPFPAFERAVSLENDHRRMRLLTLE